MSQRNPICLSELQEKPILVFVWLIFAAIEAISFPFAVFGVIFHYGGYREATGMNNVFGALLAYIITFRKYRLWTSNWVNKNVQIIHILHYTFSIDPLQRTNCVLLLPPAEKQRSQQTNAARHECSLVLIILQYINCRGRAHRSFISVFAIKCFVFYLIAVCR